MSRLSFGFSTHIQVEVTGRRGEEVSGYWTALRIRKDTENWQRKH